jgi:hypothetical protein
MYYRAVRRTSGGDVGRPRVATVQANAGSWRSSLPVLRVGVRMQPTIGCELHVGAGPEDLLQVLELLLTCGQLKLHHQDLCFKFSDGAVVSSP